MTMLPEEKNLNVQKNRRLWIESNFQNEKPLKTTESFAIEVAGHQSAALGIENSETLKDRLLKNIVFYWVICVATSYLIFVARIILFLSKDKIELPDSVVITLLATTTTTIIGLPALILYSLFPKIPKDKTKRNLKNITIN